MKKKKNKKKGKCNQNVLLNSELWEQYLHMLGKIIDFPSPTKKKQKKGEEGRKKKKI